MEKLAAALGLVVLFAFSILIIGCKTNSPTEAESFPAAIIRAEAKRRGLGKVRTERIKDYGNYWSMRVRTRHTPPDGAITANVSKAGTILSWESEYPVFQPPQ